MHFLCQTHLAGACKKVGAQSSCLGPSLGSWAPLSQTLGDGIVPCSAPMTLPVQSTLGGGSFVLRASTRAWCSATEHLNAVSAACSGSC